jgi:hypothetical protein
MWKLAIITTLTLLAAPVRGTENLRMSVSPTLSTQPAVIRVRVSIEPSDENRFIRIAAESADYFRSSEVEIDGASASRISQFEYRGLPAGDYIVRGLLIGRDGKSRGTTEYMVTVTP